MKRLTALFLVALMVMGLALASSAENAAVLRFGTDAEPIGFDPHTISAVASQRVMSQMYNTLVDVDENLNVIPELALSWEQPDEQTYVFKLREDVKFHNGRQLTAEDVKYSFERILNPDVGALGSSASYAGDIESVTVNDPFTVTIKLKKVNAPFLANLSSNYCAIVAKEVVEESGDLLRADGGTGPYTLGEWVPDNMVSIHRFADYTIKAAPAFDTIEFYVMTDASARLAALRTGSVDLINADTSMLVLAQGDSAINTIYYQSRNYSALCLSTKNEYLKDARVRQAISLAVNRQEIIDMAYNGEAEVSGFVPASMGHWAVDVTNHPMYQQDIARAKELLAEAGYPNGFEVDLYYASDHPFGKELSQTVQELAEIGITVNVVNKENAEYVALWSAHDFQMMACQNGAGSDPSRGVGFFFRTGNSANIAEYSNARVDELIDLGASTTDVDTRRGYYQEAIDIILTEAPNVVIASPREYFMASPKLQGYAPSASNPYDLSAAYFGE